MKLKRLLMILIVLILIFACSFMIDFTGLSSIVNGNVKNSVDLRSNEAAEEPENILFLGRDKVSNSTDSMILLRYDPSAEKLYLLSIPRDTRVRVRGSSIPKINSAYPVGGIEKAVGVVENLLNVRIKNYVVINTSTFREVIDLLGGIDINIPTDMDYDDPDQDLHIHLKKGLQHLDGEGAEQFVRFRKPNEYNEELMNYYDGSDIKRIDSQQEFIREFIKQKVNMKYIPKAKDILETIFDNIETDIDISDVIKMVSGASGLKQDRIEMLKLPGKEVDEDDGSYYILDNKKTNEIISKYFR